MNLIHVLESFINSPLASLRPPLKLTRLERLRHWIFFFYKLPISVNPTSALMVDHFITVI